MSNAANGGMLVPEATQIETASGRFVDVLNPDPATIDPADIAHGLAMTCRYGGHVSTFYSVAEHAVLVHDLLRHQGVEGELLFAALLHDAAEAYLGDIVSPLKYALRVSELRAIGCPNDRLVADVVDFRGTYSRLSESMERAIGERFKIDPALFDDPAVQLADMWALAIEARALTRSKGANWRWPGELPEDGQLPRDVVWTGGLAPNHARDAFWRHAFGLQEEAAA